MKKITTISVMLLMLVASVSATLQLPEPEQNRHGTWCPVPYISSYCLYRWIQNQDFGKQVTVIEENTHITRSNDGNFNSATLGVYLVGDREFFPNGDYTKYLSQHFVPKKDYDNLVKHTVRLEERIYELSARISALE